MSVSGWVQQEGFGIVKFPFLPTGEKQIPLLAGDQIEIKLQNGEWYFGKVLSTEVSGIFPVNHVAFYKKQKDDVKEMLLAKPEDLLHREAALVISAAFSEVKMTEPGSHENNDKIIKLLTSVRILMDIIGKFEINKDKPELFPQMHSEMAREIDFLRQYLNVPQLQRTTSSSIPTMTTWGKEMFLTKNEGARTCTLPQYVLAHVKVEVKNLEKPTFFRFALTQKKVCPWVSAPVSAVLSPTSPTVEFLFDQLDLSIMKDKTFLCIYSYEFLPTKNSGTEDRRCTSCCLIEVPSCSRKFFAADKTYPRSGNSRTAAPDVINNLHYNMLQENVKTQFTLQYAVEYSAYQGTYNTVTDKHPNFRTSNLVSSFSIPSAVLPTENRQTLFFSIKQIKHNGNRRKRIRALIRLFDPKSCTFVRCIENAETGLFDRTEWTSASVIGASSIRSSETFGIDLTKTTTPIKDLRIVVQFQQFDDDYRTFEIALIPITEEDGTLKQNWSKFDANTHEYKGRGEPKPEFFKTYDGEKVKKSSGMIGYILSFASTAHTCDGTLHKLVSIDPVKLLRENSFGELKESDVTNALQRFHEVDISEWSHFIKKLLMNACAIIAMKENLVGFAYEVLKRVMIETTVTPSYGAHADLLQQFAMEDFKAALAQQPQLASTYSTLLAKIRIAYGTDENPADETSPQYRSFIKITPYLLQLVAQSFYAMNQGRKDGDVLKQFKTKIKEIFDKFKDIVERKPLIGDGSGENSTTKNSILFAQQQLILMNFASMVDTLHVNMSHDEISKIIRDFMSAVRLVDQDKRQKSIDKSKIRIIQNLAGTQCWTNNSERACLKDQFKDELQKASNKPHTLVALPEILASLFLSVRDEFILGFLPTLEMFFNDASAQQQLKPMLMSVTRLLLSVIYAFPDSFAENRYLDLAIRVMSTESATGKINIESDDNRSWIGPHERLFVFESFVRNSQDKLAMNLESIDLNTRRKLFKAYLTLAVAARDLKKQRIDLTTWVYPNNVDFQSLAELFDTIDDDEMPLYEELVLPLFKAFAEYSTPYGLEKHEEEKAPAIEQPALVSMFTKLMRKELIPDMIKAISEMSGIHGFRHIYRLFAGSDDAKDVADFSRYLADTQREESFKNQDMLVEAYTEMVKLCNKYKIDELKKRLLKNLAELQKRFENKVECAFIIVELARTLPINDAMPTEDIMKYIPFMTIVDNNNNNAVDDRPRFKIENMSCMSLREGVFSLYMTAIKMLKEEGFESFALPIIDEVKERCVAKDRIYNLMTKILEQENSLYTHITATDHNYSRFYRVEFRGKGFDIYYKDRVLIYRVKCDQTLGNFTNSIKQLFDTAEVFNDPMKFTSYIDSMEGNSTAILVQEVEPITKEQIDDKLCVPLPEGIPRYILDFKQQDGVNSFLIETSASTSKVNEYKDNATTQTIIYTDGKFPSMKRRLEVIPSMSSSRNLLPIENAILAVERKRRNIALERATLERITENGGVIPPTYSDHIKATNLTAVAFNNNIENIVEAFLSKEFIQNAPDQRENLERLRKALGRFVDDYDATSSFAQRCPGAEGSNSQILSGLKALMGNYSVPLGSSR